MKEDHFSQAAENLAALDEFLATEPSPLIAITGRAFCHLHNLVSATDCAAFLPVGVRCPRLRCRDCDAREFLAEIERLAKPAVKASTSC